MSQDIHQFVTARCTVLALGEPTHQEPAFARLRNELFVQLVERGFRSIALETDAAAAHTVNDFVHGGPGSIDAVLRTGFSHGFGELADNRRLVAWMRDHNENRPPEDRVSFHGFDAATEMMSAPSPLRYLEHARDYLGAAGLPNLADLAGDDERWSRTEAVLDPDASVGATAAADALRVVADDLLTTLHARAPELIRRTSRAEWFRARSHLTAGLGLLRYHKQAARGADRNERISRLSGTRDALMAQNLLDVRLAEAGRGPTMVFAHNLHLQRCSSAWALADMSLSWFGAGAIVAPLIGERYTFIAGSLGRSAAIGLGEPEPDTYEGALQRRFPAWGLTAATAVDPARTRADTTPPQGYFPLDQPTLDGADAVLHIGDGELT